MVSLRQRAMSIKLIFFIGNTCKTFKTEFIFAHLANIDQIAPSVDEDLRKNCVGNALESRETNPVFLADVGSNQIGQNVRCFCY